MRYGGRRRKAKGEVGEVGEEEMMLKRNEGSMQLVRCFMKLVYWFL